MLIKCMERNTTQRESWTKKNKKMAKRLVSKGKAYWFEVERWWYEKMGSREREFTTNDKTIYVFL